MLSSSRPLLLALQHHSKALVVFAMVSVLLIFWKDIIISSVNSISLSSVKDQLYRKPKSSDSIANRTLGFQEIFALALPDRTDRIAPLQNAANATNITLTIMDAVRDNVIPDENVPKQWKKEDHAIGELGCLRSHVMAWERIIKNNIKTALVIESDADWDMRIHDILPGVADGSRTIADWPFTAAGHPRDFATDASPYGDNWDILWIGHCGSTVYIGNGRIYSFKDVTVPPNEMEYTFAGKPDKSQHPDGTRLVYEFTMTTCTSGYAISNQGAHKLKKFLAESNDNIDVRMWRLCNDEHTLLCLGVWPQVITAAPSESNIKHKDGDTAPGMDVEAKKITAGPALQYSARRNALVVQQGLGRDKWIKEF